MGDAKPSTTEEVQVEAEGPAPFVDPLADARTSDLRKLVESRPHHTDKGLLIFEDKLPEEVVAKVWALAHQDPLCGHGGVTATTARVRAALSAPGLALQVRRLTLECPVCQKVKAKKARPEIMASTRATAPFESLFMDFIGPLRESNGLKHILVMIDRFSHAVQLVATADVTAATTAKHLYEDWICLYGVPKLLTTDGGSGMDNYLMADVLEKLNVQHHVSAPHHPEGHGAVERTNYTVERIIQTVMKDSKLEWTSLVKPTAFAINTMYCRAIGASPFKILHGMDARIPLNVALDAQAEPLASTEDSEEPLGFAQNLLTVTAGLRKTAREVQDKAYKEAASRKADRASGKQVYNAGDLCLVHFPPKDKLDVPWKGLFRVLSKKPDLQDIYEVQDILTKEAFNCKIDRMHVFHVGRLAPEEVVVVAQKDGEYIIEKVLGHAYNQEGQLCLYVKWLGYAQEEPTAIGSWTVWPDCRTAPAAKAYAKDNKLPGRISAKTSAATFHATHPFPENL